MSKRNFILLIIVLVIIVLVVFGFLYMRQNAQTPGEDGGGTNFLSQFNPFGTGGKPSGTPTGQEPVDVSGYEPGPEQGEIKLKKVSSMPIAGFTVYAKERLIEVPPIITPTTPEETDPKPTTNTKPVPPATEFVSALRYVDRTNGNIYQTFADKIEERRFSGTVIPKVYETKEPAAEPLVLVMIPFFADQLTISITIKKYGA